MSAQATIMTDPGTADRTYIGPMSADLVEEIIEKVCITTLRLDMAHASCMIAVAFCSDAVQRAQL